MISPSSRILGRLSHQPEGSSVLSSCLRVPIMLIIVLVPDCMPKVYTQWHSPSQVWLSGRMHLAAVFAWRENEQLRGT
jgi:hypothetical protein